jgi:hypothetical protein
MKTCNTYQSSEVLSVTSTLWRASNARSPGSCTAKKRHTFRYPNTCGDETGWNHVKTLTALEYSYNASAHSPCVSSSSGSGTCLLGSVGCGGASWAGALLTELEGTCLTGGGANAFFFAANADGTGAAMGGGVAVLFAVEFRREVNRFFADDVSTSPNF